MEQLLIAALEKRKIIGNRVNHFHCKFYIPLSFLLLLQLMICTCAVSGREVGWDGVIITEADYHALQAFKHEIVDPAGFLRSWNDSGYGACSGGWAGIKCAQGQVIVLQLPWKGLSGRITEKIGELNALRKLSLHDNSIAGQIPYSLGFLQNLRGLQLFNNRLSGSIPPSLGPGLQTLDLSNNLLTGSIPNNLISSTKLLYRLNLSFNSISGSIPFNLTQSPSLIFLNLDHNNLTGTIPDSWAPSRRLTTLDLSYNAINGTLPSTYPSSLISLNLQRNDFAGEIPISLGDLKNLRFLNVSYNNLSGQVPTVLTQKFNSSSFIGNVQLCGVSVNNPACPSSQPGEAPSQEQKQTRHGLGIKDVFLIAAGILLVILLILCLVLLYCLIRTRGTANEGQPSIARAEKGIAVAGGKEGEAAAVAAAGEGGAGGKLVHFDGGVIVFTADDLLCATAEIMGKSTYGTVYKATLEDGSQVAVKRLREKITKGQKEFEAEVNVLGKIRHPNLVAMRAYYVGPKGEKLLVFDYMPRGSLATFLHARGPDTAINWATRMRIIQGMARGLSHLHHVENLIHGNLTSNNILLHNHHHLEEEEDQQGRSSSSLPPTAAKISDYGLSRLMNPSAGPNVIAAAAALGYRAPELSKLKKANAKTDVYSFGVIVLEILTGKSPGDATNGGGDLPQWVANIVKEEWTNEVFDVELMSDAATIGDELLNTLKLALHCVDPSPTARPEARLIVQHLQEIHASSPPPASASRGGGGGASTSGLSPTGAAGGASGSDTGTHSRVQSD